MSEPNMSTTGPDTPITLEDLRHKALAIREEVKDEVHEQVTSRRNQFLIFSVVAVVAVVSIAYFAGSKAGRRAAESQTY
jgi:hypothetical protein